MRAMFAPDGSVVRGHVLFAAIPLLVALLAAACSNVGSVEPTVAASAPASGDESRTEVTEPGPDEATVGVAATAGETTDSSGVPFVARPEARGGSSYMADTILALRYGVHQGYERVVIDLGTGDEPAETVPEWTLMSSADDGLLRVTLPSTSATGVSNGKLGDALLESFHVVRAPDGGMFVDFFARKAFVYRVLELSDPAWLVMDFKPGGESLEVPLPAVGGNTVLVEPRGRPDRGSPHHKRLLSQLRGVEHHRPDGFRRRGRDPAHRPEQRLDLHLGILRGDPGSPPVQRERNLAGRGQERPGRNLRRRRDTGPRKLGASGRHPRPSQRGTAQERGRRASRRFATTARAVDGVRARPDARPQYGKHNGGNDAVSTAGRARPKVLPDHVCLTLMLLWSDGYLHTP